MLGLPSKTELNKRINKSAIYNLFNLDSKQKESFDEDISFIYIVNEISENSINISKGESVPMIHVIRVILKDQKYKDANIAKLFKTNWQPLSEAKLDINGLNLDTVYENFITQIGGFIITNGHSLDEQIAADEQKAKLEKEIARLERQARNEKQPKKKFELVQMIKKLGKGDII